MIGTLTFKKFTGEEIDTITYIKNYCQEHKNDNIKIIIGTDSQNKNNKTIYSTVIALYTPGHGAHCIFKRWNTKKEKVRNTRLLNEVEASLNIAKELTTNGCPKPDYIDIDINPNPKYKSNEVYDAAKGWIEGMGYEVRYKTLAPLVTSMADWLVRH